MAIVDKSANICDRCMHTQNRTYKPTPTFSPLLSFNFQPILIDSLIELSVIAKFSTARFGCFDVK